MRAIKIISIGQVSQVTTQYGTKDTIRLVVRDVSMTDPKHNISASMFIPKDGIWFKVGDMVLAEITQNGQYYNIKHLERFDTEQAEPSPPPPLTTFTVEGKVDWDGKDRRLYAQNACRHADVWVSNLTDFGIDDKEKEYFRFAEKVYKWIMSK